MRKMQVYAVAVLLAAICAVAFACGEDATSSATVAAREDTPFATPSPDAVYTAEGRLKTLGKERVFTRSGPGTGFRDTGTYTVAGGLVRVYTCAFDASGKCWVQCDFPYKDKLRRLYTRLEDIDAACFDLSDVPQEAPLDYKAKVTAVTKLGYGPGDGYATYGNSFKSAKGATVYITALEGDYAQVEWTTTKQSYRVWVPTSILKY